VRVLGPLQVRRGGEEVDPRGPRPQLLLAILLASADQVVALDRLIADPYGDDPPPTARKSAQVHISNLRRAFGDDGPLTTLPGGYMFDTSGVEVDAIVFEREVGAAVALAASDPERASASGATDGTDWPSMASVESHRPARSDAS
jgi:DNA-binding SARP family transcriptional activator